ncbi:MAG: DUF4843 domain-containing protein [Rikenellaceae bacterium]|nr:DUF4843 domain-containing protein [Rikenellaceae bacterium]
MKSIIPYFILVGVGSLFLGSCSKESPTAYENDPRLYFWHEDNRNYGDQTTQRESLVHTFVNYESSVTRDTVWVALQTMGEIASYDRPVSLAQSNIGEPDAAVSGTYFLPLEQLTEELIIPAGKAFHFVPIVLLRDESLSQGIYELALEIRENDYFKLGLPDYLTFTITTTDVLTQPSNWNIWGRYFGAS